MRKNALCIVALILAAAFIAAPAAAGIYSPMKLNPLKISAPRTYLSGLDVKDTTTFQPFQASIQKMNLTPAPIPQMSMKSNDGKWDYNWGSDRFKPGGFWIM
jgi:hypothetical protein